MRIALDAMGGDFAPKNNVEGAVLALKEYPELEKLFLVGDFRTSESKYSMPRRLLR
jgi:glycerol-3-phosphate acyltransferase PlsX